MKIAFSQAPIELKILFYFSSLISIFNLFILFFGLEQLKLKLIPFTGWGLGHFYFNLTIFTFVLIVTKIPKKIWLRNLAVIALLTPIAIDAYYFYFLRGPQESENPFLTVSELRPIWQVYIPLIWVAVLLTPRVSKFFQNLA